MSYKDYSVQSYFINVGVGDCAVHFLLEGDDIQEAVLIDGGRATAATTLITNIKDIAGQSNFDLIFRSIVVTHWDNDHYGGLLEMLFTDWKETHGKGDSTYIGPDTVFYCPNTALEKFGEHNKIKIKQVSGGYELYFRDKKKNGAYQEYSMCKAVPSTYCIGYDLFSGAHYSASHIPFKKPKQWPVKSLAPIFQECEALKDKTMPIFLVVGIDGRFMDDEWMDPNSSWKSESSSRNASSIMAIVVWPTTNKAQIRVSLYTGGDAEMSQEQELLDWLDATPNVSVSVDVVKAGHHGSHEATKERLLMKKLQRFIITAGSEYGHPSFAVVYVFLVVAEYCKSQGASYKPKILCTRAPYWLTWQPDQLSGTDINLGNVVGWSDNATAIQKAIQVLTKNAFNSYIFDQYSEAMRCMKSYYTYAKTQEQIKKYPLDFFESPLTQVTGWTNPPLPKGQKADYFYEQAIRKVWDIVKPLWIKHGEPAIDSGRGVQFIMVEALGNKPKVTSEVQELTLTIAKKMKESLLSSLRDYDYEFLVNLNTAKTGTSNSAYNPLAWLAKEEMKKRKLMVLELSPSFITEENAAVKQWTVGLLSKGLESKADLSDTFSGICLDKSKSACGAWFSSCFNKTAKMIFTGKKAKDSGITLDRLNVEFELGSNVDSISVPLESASVLTLTTSRDSRIAQFGDNAKDEQQTELGFDSRLEGVLLALDVASSSTNISFGQFCDLINYPLSPSISNLLKPLVLQPLPQNRSGLWFVPKYVSRSILRIAMKPSSQDGVGSELQTLFESGLGPLIVSNVAVIGTCVAEAPSSGLIETSSKLSIEADLSLKEEGNAPASPFEGRARITFTNKGWEVALKCKKGGVLNSLLTWAESIMKNPKANQKNGGSETPRLFESESTAKKTEEALSKVMSEGADINLHTVLLSFDNEMNIESFRVEMEISMVLKKISVPFLATLSWRRGVFALSCRLWPNPSFGQLPELLHPYYESTAVSHPFDQNPTYKLPLKDLLRMPDADLPPGIPNTIIDAWMEVSFGAGCTTAALSSIIKCDPKQGEKDQGSGPPLFQLDEVDMSLGLSFPHGSGLPEVSVFFDAAITLAIPDAHRPDASTTDVDKYTKIKVAFEYDRTNEEKSLWVARSRIQNITVANIYQLFSTDGSGDAILDVMASIRICSAEMWYEHRSEGPNALKLNGSILLGPPRGDNSIQLDLSYSHEKGSWSFDAYLEPGEGEKGLKLFRVANMLSGLVEDEAELPEFLRNLEVPLNALKAHLSCSTVDFKGGKYVVFSLNISIGHFTMTLAQVRSVTAAKARVAAVNAMGNNTESGDGHSKPARLLRFELSELPKVPSVPVIGITPQPFDSLGIVWTNRDITATEIEVLNLSVFKDQRPLQVKESESGVGSLIAGCHFQISLLEGSQPKVVLDHVVGGDKPSEKAKTNRADAVVKYDEQNLEEEAEEPDPTPELRAPDTRRSVAPMAKTFGTLSVRNIGLAIEGKSLSTINISLDASVRLGPVAIALLGFSFNIDFSKMKDPRDLKDLVSKPHIEGMAVSLEKPPTRLAGTFVSFKESSTEGFMGAIAVSLKAWSAIAGGVYAENKIDLTKSVFAFALLRGPIFSFGCAEVVGLTGGFGYNSQLALPELSQLPEFPFIALNSATGVPGKIMDQLATLRGGEGKKGWVTMAPDDMWFVGGIGLKAFQTIDAQILLSLALSSEPKFTVLAQATAVFPRSLEIDPNAQDPLANAFLVLDIVLRADIDPFHGSILAAGELTPKSFILNPSCRLSGGFALAYFLSGSPHEGDFVFTVGGYHPRYTPPAHYPAAVKRVEIRWEIDPQLRLSGEAYFALTPQVVMGGGRLDIVLDKGWLRAGFSAYANFMMHFHPFQFDIEVSISLIVEVILPAVLFTLHLGPLEFSATLALRGPPVSGTASLHLWRWDVEVMFGPRRVEANALEWGQFLRMVKNLPIEAADGKADAVPHHVLTVTKGAVTAEKKTEHGEGRGIYSTETMLTSEPESVEIRGTEFGFELQTRVPVQSAIIGTGSEVELAAGELFARPMQLQSPIKVSRLVVTLTRNETGEAVPMSGKPIQKRVGPVLWGKYDNSPDSAAKAASESMLSHVMGYDILVEDQLPSDEDLPAIDISQFNAIEIGKEGDNVISPIEPAQNLEDDHLFSLVQDHGLPAIAYRLVLEDPQNKQMELAKLKALEAWSLFRMQYEGGGISVYGCSVSIHRPAAFRIAWGLQAVPGAILFVSLFFFPESPRWLASKDRWEECHEILANLHARGDRSNIEVLAELEEVREAARIAAESKEVSYLGLFAPRMWKRTLVGVSAQVWQQLLGGNVMLYYLVYIFNMAGMSGNAALTSSIIQYVIFLVTTGGVLFVIDRMGRRWLLIVGAIICGVIHFTVGAVMAVYGHHVDNVDGIDILKWQISGPPAKAVIALCYIFVGVYGVTWAPGAWIYCGEVFPLKYRAKGVGLAAAGNWAFNLALAFFVPPAFTNIQWKAYMIFGTFCIAMVFHVYFMYPETVKKSLEEIDVLFDENIPAWRSASAVSTFEEKVVCVKETGGIEQAKQQGDVDHEEKV